MDTKRTGKRNTAPTEHSGAPRAVDHGTTAAFFLASFLLWEVIVRIFHVPRYIIAPPSAVMTQMAARFTDIYKHTLATSLETFVGFGIAVLVGVPLAMATAFSRFLRQTFYPLAVTLEMVPKIAFAPIFVIWLGFGFGSKMVVVLLVCFFPILINGVFGFTSLPTELQYLSRSTGAGAIRAFVKIRLPYALPQLFVGFKGAAVNATIGATIAEWIGGNAGLGYFISMSTGLFRMDIAIAAIIVLTALGLLLYGIVLWVETKMIPWHVSQRARINATGSA